LFFRFTHCRRFFGECKKTKNIYSDLFFLAASSSDCTIEARIADNFRIKKADFDAIIIVKNNQIIYLIFIFVLF
jgi:hypothetical protein